MAWISLGGKTRRFRNTDTGEEISRRQYQNLVKGISFEAKAKKSKESDLAKALARPARGRTKATTQAEIESRLEAAAIQAENKRVNKIARAATQKAGKIRVKKIRPQLLKSGHRAARIAFTEYDDYVESLKQARTQRAPNGRRLITSYGLGITGYDERTGQELDATLVTLQSPSIVMDEDELQEITDDFVYEHPYFIFSHWWLHLQFDIDYAEKRAAESRKKNSQLGKRPGKRK